MDVQSILRRLGDDDKKVGEILGVHRTTVYRMRRGKKPSFATVEALLKVQDTAVEEQRQRRAKGRK